MTLKVTMTSADLGTLIDAYDGLSDRLRNDEDGMRLIGEAGRQMAVEEFLQQGRSSRWIPPAPATLARRKSRGNFGTDALRDTDETMLSFLGEGNEHTIFEVSRHKVSWGNSREDFEAHDEGSDNEPVRTVLEILDEDQTIFTSTYLDWVMGDF